LRVDPDDLGDRRRLPLQLQVLDPPLLERVAVAVGPRQRRPGEVMLDVGDVPLDPRRRVLRLLLLQRVEVVPRLAPREVNADRTAGDEHAADQRNDQQRVLRKEAPAARHCCSADMTRHLDSFRSAPARRSAARRTTS
jgi:hypothetical protein